MSTDDSQKGSRSVDPGRQTISGTPTAEAGKIGRYDIIYPIAFGGMATVYVGRMSGMAGFERLVAVKVIHPHLAQEKSFVEMFLDEARHAAGIHHQNVGEIYEVGEDTGLYYMVGELVLGQDLNRLLSRAYKRTARIDYTLCAYIISRVCRGLHEAHNLVSAEGEPVNLVHRDISPRNILISYKGDVKLIDFGVAWARGRLSNTEAGSVKGKVGFIPPEHIRGESLDRRSDIFTLGVVLYLLATGSHPFPGKSDAERLTKILTGRVSAPHVIDPNIPMDLQRVVLKAMMPLREERYQTAAEMARDLDAFIRQHKFVEHADLLSNMMNDFFEDEVKEHKEKIRSYRKLYTDSPDSSIPEMLVMKTSAPAGASWGADVSTGDAREFSNKPRRAAFGSKAVRSLSTRDIRRRGRVPRRKQIVKGAIALIALVLSTILAFSLFDSDGSTKEEKSNRATSARVEKESSNPQNANESPGDRKVKAGILTTGRNSPKGSEKIEFIIITLNISEPEAIITLDGRIYGVGIRDLTILADGQEHSLMVEKQGFFTHYDTITADVNRELIVELKSLAGAEAPDLESETLKKNVGKAQPKIERPVPKSAKNKKRWVKPKNAKTGSKRSPTLERSPYR